MGFCLSESHGGKEVANAAICEPVFFGSALIESARILGLEIGNGFNREDTVF
jgi:hypothetical protein